MASLRPRIGWNEAGIGAIRVATRRTGTLTARDLAGLSRDLYADAAPLMRTLQRWRPYICPFENLLPFVPDNATVLDVGCGSGLFLGLLVASGHDIASGVGFDASPDAIDAAQHMARVVERREGRAVLAFHRLDVAAPWPAGPFDVVAIIDVIHHVPPGQQSNVLEAASSRVAPGGVLIYKDMCRRPLWRAGMNRLHDIVLARQWIHYLPIDEAERCLCATGLRVRHRATANRVWYGHELLVFDKPERAATPSAG